MAIQVACSGSYLDQNNKQRKCGIVEPLMDPKTEQVFCPTCDVELIVGHFQKTTMKSIKQFRQKAHIPFGVKCQKCHKEMQPQIMDEEIVCPNCHCIHSHLSEPFKNMLKIQLKTANKEVI
jgi:Zn finger protein HypA/HybF involved in hydrogenase expression